MEALIVKPSSIRRRAWFIGLLAGFVAGVLNAVVARLLMRIIALVISGHGSFSVGGTAVIFMFGALVGPLFGWIYRLTVYRLHANTLIKGLLFGLFGVIAVQVPGLYASPDFRNELMVVGPLGFGVFGAMNFAFVLTLAPLTAWLERAWPQDDSRRGLESGLVTVFGLMGLAGLILIVVEIGGRAFGMLK